MIPAVITGITIDCVWARSQIAPASAAPAPTRSQDEKPRSRIHLGAAKIPLNAPGSISMTSSSSPALSRPGRRKRLRKIARRSLIGPSDDTRHSRRSKRVE